VGAAILLCVIGCGSFLLGELYHISPAWLSLSWNSIGLFMILLPKEKECSELCILKVAAEALPYYWVPLMGLELFIGFLAANLLFGIVPHRRQ
jgi:hypothetical protein